MARLLQWLGVLFVLSLVGGATAGFVVLRDRVNVVISEDAAREAVDPVALLRDDVAGLGRTVSELQQAIADNFGKLGRGLEAGAAQRTDELRQRLVALGAANSELTTRLSRLEDRLAANAPALAGGGTVPVAPPGPVVASPESSKGGAATANAPDVSPAPPPAIEPVAPAPTTTFLSFTVPKAVFAFDVVHDFDVVPELSRVGFDAKSTLHDFSGVTSQLRGSFRADLAGKDGAWSGGIEVQAATLGTGVDGRDTNMREHLEVTAHPTISFAVARFVAAADGVDIAGRTSRGTVHGRMTIRGVSREVEMPIRIEVDPQQRVVVTGQVPLLLSDYGVPVPSQLGLVNMQDEVKVWIALRARARAGAVAGAAK